MELLPLYSSGFLIKEEEMKEVQELIAAIDGLDIEEKVKAINEAKAALQSISPFKFEPVDCVQWVKEELVIANDYNPNTVAPPEMSSEFTRKRRTLRLSVSVRLLKIQREGRMRRKYISVVSALLRKAVINITKKG